MRRGSHSVGLSALICLLLLASLSACKAIDPRSKIEGTSLLGEDLVRDEAEGERAEKLDADLDAALANWSAAPSEMTAIWVGRRIAYTGRYREAIQWYSERIRDFPHSYKLLRHRGHRYISVRELPLAIADLSLAALRSRGLPDEVEPDGAPNRYGIPTSTTQSNIYYHLGLAHYVLGDFTSALDAYGRCLDVSRVNNDMWAATAHWTYLTLRRLEQEDTPGINPGVASFRGDANAVLASLPRELIVIENAAYRDTLRMYRGELWPDEVLARNTGGIGMASAGYGVATWLNLCGEEEKANELLHRIIDEAPWSAFGRIAAEADLAR
ncbi:MAG: tetratricopeptide (TPR) repeat protein [Planctomycetota bacterium]|jgi:tetratricopeptide (TPR) repeat protein